jgi:hypothetical protein
MSRLARAIGEDLDGALTAAIESVIYVRPVIVLVAVGFALILLRTLFLDSAEWMCHHADLVAIFMDGMMVRSLFVMAELKLWKKALFAALEITLIAEGDGELITDLAETIFNPAEIKYWIRTTAVDCQPYDSFSAVTAGVFRLASPAVCPLLRYVYPVDWLYAIAGTLLGWLSADPDPEGANCVDSDPIDVSCVLLGLGYIVLDFLLPITLFALLLPILRPCIYTIYVAVGAGVHAAAMALRLLHL